MKKNIKNICILTSVHPVFDTRIFHKEAKTLTHSGYDVTIIAQHAKNETVEGIKIIALQKPKNKFQRMTKTVWKLFRLAYSEKAYIYHFHDPELILVCLLLKLFTKARVIYDVHEDYYTSILLRDWTPPFSHLRRLAAWIFNVFEKKIAAPWFDTIILAELYYQELFSHIKDKCVTVLNYPILKSDHQKKISQNIKILRKNSFNIIYTGRVTEARGALCTIYGFIELAKAHNNIDLYLVGYLPSKNLAEKIDKLLQKHDLSNRVQIIGRGKSIPRETIDAYYPYMHVGIAPIPYHPHYKQKLLTKFFEYMINEIPIIVTDFPLWEKLIKENKCGLAIDPLDSKKFAQAIEYLMNNPREAKKMGENGKQAILEKYNWKKESKKLLKLYTRLSPLKLNIKKIKKSFIIQAVKNNTIFATKGYTIYKSKNQGKTWNLVSKIKAPFISLFFSKFRLSTRLFRLGIHNLIVLNSNTIIAVINKKILRRAAEKKSFKVVHKIINGRRPLRQAFSEDGDGKIYYGEYWNNPRGKSVSIFKSADDGKTWYIFHTFPPNSIRHIHTVAYDNRENCLWVSTGDNGKQCQIIKINLKNKSIEIVGSDGQKWRTISFVFTKNFVYWGTDLALGPNFIYQYNRQINSIKKVYQTSNPFGYSILVNDIIFFSTIVDKFAKNKRKNVVLLSSKNGTDWEQIACWKKDIWSPKFLQYGTIYFPYDSNYSTKLFFTPIALKNVDQQLLSYNIYK